MRVQRKHGAPAAVVLVVLVVLAVGTAQVGASPTREERWKGAETLELVTIGPALDRCGPPPIYLEGRFVGTGLDSIGGAFVVAASGCLDTQALRLFDLEATDTFTASGASLTIVPEDVDLDLNTSTCVAVNRQPVPFTVAAGTGALEGAAGHGTFDLALSYPPCGGAAQPAHVWFKGVLQLPG
ncbi:MAG: hypothetical protein M3O70_20735 [Actinomycetota bacterium]|nr:hypothetical protein [Actinomycetota bacterium]